MTAWLALALLAPSPTQTVSQQKFKQAVVVSDSQIASEVGAAILKQGGNAVDAAIATHFALAVTFPTAGNLGGGGFMVVRMADGQTSAIDYRETAPAAATRDMYLGPDGQADPALSLEGWKAVAVPGSVAGMAEAHRMYGTLPWKALVEPAFALADKGFVVSDSLANQLRAKMSLFRRFPGAYEAFNRSGKPYEWGETFVQPSLAKVLRRIADQGPREFYEGETAQRLASEMKRNGGLITVEDLASYRAVVRKPIEFDYRGHRVLTMPPPSSGGVAVGQMLRMLEPFDLREMGFHSAQRTHLLIEVMKRAFADRAEFMGDPDHVRVPVAEMMADERLTEMRKSIRPDAATPASEINPRGSIPPREGDHTTHFTVVDAKGNAVSNTTTINTGYGSGVAVEGLGFLLNNEMDDFAAQPGKPNGYGLVQGEANAVGPRKRPLSSMTPTLVLLDGKLVLALGSPGGPTIINTVLQTILNVLDHRMNIQQAVSAPRLHHQWLPDEIRTEPFGVSNETRAALEKLGHKFGAPSTMGSCHAVFVEPSGARVAGVDPRIAGAGAAGY